MGKKLYVHDGSNSGGAAGFKEVSSPDFKYFASTSSTSSTAFSAVKKGYYHPGGSSSSTAFEEFYLGSDPVTYTFIANSSASFRDSDYGSSWNTANSAAAVKTGAFSSGNSPYVGVFGFGTMEGGGLTLAQALAERPFVTNATTSIGGTAENYVSIRRKTNTDSGGSGAPAGCYGTWYLAMYDGNATDSSSDADDCNFATNASFTRASNNILNHGDTMTIDLNGSSANRTKMQTFVNHAATKGLLLTSANSITNVKATSGTRPETEYAFFYGSGETTPPKLVVTLDYVSA